MGLLFGQPERSFYANESIALTGNGSGDTLGLGPDVWRVFAKAHEVRNRSEYEGDQGIDRRLLTDLLAACARVAAKVRALPNPPA